MCYSAMVKQSGGRYGVEFEARVDLGLVLETFRARARGEKITIGRAEEKMFSSDPKIAKLVEKYRLEKIQEDTEGLMAQKLRVSQAKELLKKKETKKALKDLEIGTRKIERYKRSIKNRKLKGVSGDQRRFFPFYQVPIIVPGKKSPIIRLSRYHLRPFFADEKWDRQKGGCYNARRDKLTSSWKAQFGKNHGLIEIESFYENVGTKDYRKNFKLPKKMGENIEICFEPESDAPLYVPCIFDEWTDGETMLHSFALITDEPPSEVSATGHDRCPIFLTSEAARDWLNGAGRSNRELNKILDMRRKILSFPNRVLELDIA